MTLRTSLLVIAATLAIPGVATAQSRGTPAQRAGNVRQAADIDARIAAVDARIGVARNSRSITRARASTLHRQLAQTRRSMTTLSRRQGFVSAAERASYTRTLDGITAELDRRGAPRSYGNDALPSAEMRAFARVDARLHYRNARIDYDRRDCAIYQGTDRNGQVHREPLLSSSGQQICARR